MLASADLDAFAEVIYRILQHRTMGEAALVVYAFARARAPVIDRSKRPEAIRDEVMTLRRAQNEMTHAVAAALAMLLLQERIRLINGMYYPER